MDIGHKKLETMNLLFIKCW